MDKGTLAALQATLLHYARGEAEREVPVWRMIASTLDELAARAADLAAMLCARRAARRRSCSPRRPSAAASLPGETLPTWAVAVAAAAPDALAAALRHGDPPVVGRIVDGQLLLDLRTVPPGMDEVVLRAVQAAGGTKKDE